MFSVVLILAVLAFKMKSYQQTSRRAFTPLQGAQRSNIPPIEEFNLVPMELDDVGVAGAKQEVGELVVTARDLEVEEDIESVNDAQAVDIEDNDTHNDAEEDHQAVPMVAHSPLIGPNARCHKPTCRRCDDMQVANTPSLFVSHATREYLEEHIRIAVVTGSFDDFFRMDLGLCTWMGHVPPTSLHVFTDRANTSSMKHVGTWHEARLPPHLTFSKKQMHAKGYTIDWIRAQYRFFQAFDTIGAENAPSFHWAAVVDDDTFINLEALRGMLTAYDARELRLLNISLPLAGVSPAARQRQLSLLVTAHKHRFRPLYLNDHGWGGAGHFMNFAALKLFANGSEATCVDRYMVRRGYASDVTLRHCLPKLRILTIHEKRLSHCQAAFLKHRLASPLHVSAHVKRDVVMPRFLALWRMRLYYQVVYHRNTSTPRATAASQSPHRSAFDVLMDVGACAYGYSCKLSKCDAAHDGAAMHMFVTNSANNSHIPTL